MIKLSNAIWKKSAGWVAMKRVGSSRSSHAILVWQELPHPKAACFSQRVDGWPLQQRKPGETAGQTAYVCG